MNNHQDKKNIMIIDDTPANLKLLQEMLQGRGYRVMAFPQGEMALKAAARKPPDLILLDIRMPGLDGFQVCTRFKEQEGLKDIPVIFISALNDPSDKVQAFAAGGVDYVTKPFHPEEVHARVATHIRLRGLQKQVEDYNLHLEKQVEEKVREISESQLATIHAMSELVELRDVETGGHIARTSNLCKALAHQVSRESACASQVNSDFIDNISRAAPLHDIGKFGIPDSILLKPNKLTKEEFENMKSHCEIGGRTLQKALERYPKNTFLSMGVDIAWYHHEKWEGSGYPLGLSGESIPLSARIMALADVYDALRSSRPYKKAFSHQESLRIIQEGSGTHFDPELVQAFTAIEDRICSILTQES